MTLAALEPSQDSYLEALRSKHALLSSRVKEAQKSPGTPDDALRLLKKQKLMIKEQIEGIRAHESLKDD